MLIQGSHNGADDHREAASTKITTSPMNSQYDLHTAVAEREPHFHAGTPTELYTHTYNQINRSRRGERF